MMRPCARTNTLSQRLITACITCSTISMVDAGAPNFANDRNDVANLGWIRVRPGPRRAAAKSARLRARGQVQGVCGRRSSGRRPARRACRRGRQVARLPLPSPARRRGRRCRRWAPTAMFSRTVRLAKGCAIWNVRAMPRAARSCGGRAPMSLPLKTMRPLVGCSKPEIEREQRRLARAIRTDQAGDAAGSPRSSEAESTASSPPKRF